MLLACTACSRRFDYGVRGCVRLEDGAPLPGVQVQIRWVDSADPWTRNEVTDADGRYEWSWPNRPILGPTTGLDHVVVVPSLAGYSFEPPSYDVVLTGMRDGLDFTASPLPELPLQVLIEFAWSPTGAGSDRLRVRVLPASR